MQDDQTSRLIFATPSAEEEQQIREGLASYIPEEAVNLFLAGQHLIIGKGRRHEVFLLSEALWKLYQQIQPQHPYFIGLFLGELKESALQPSLHILHRLADVVKPSAKVVAVSKGEQRFLFGHSLESQEFQVNIPDSGGTKKVLVMNSQGEGLGYGQVVKTSAGKVSLNNRVDLGWYLRRGR